MATPIIAALRTRRDLKASLLHTATELAHLASIYGIARASYRYLAWKCHCSRRTVMRHIERLRAAGILRKTVLWIRGNYCEINTYAFLIPWDTRRPRGGSDKTAATLPRHEREKERVRWEEKEKTGSVRQELANQKRMLPMLYTPGTDQWHKTCEEIARLETLLACGG
jgi:DNA-binding Lrp family transcriptional regulator